MVCLTFKTRLQCALLRALVAQGIEHQLAELVAAGSNPAGRTSFGGGVFGV